MPLLAVSQEVLGVTRLPPVLALASGAGATVTAFTEAGATVPTFTGTDATLPAFRSRCHSARVLEQVPQCQPSEADATVLAF